MKNTAEFVTKAIINQLDELAVSVSPDAADEISLAMVRGCIRSFRGSKPQLRRLIELMVDEAWTPPKDRLQ
jgi:hypothetical protein